MNSAVNDPEILEALYWQEGLSMHRIAQRLDCSESKVYTEMVKHGIDRRGRGYNSTSPTAGQELRKTAQFRTQYGGYETWNSSRDADGFTTTYVHQLILVAHGEDPHEVYSDSFHTHHKNGVKWDNRPDNLELLTASEHMKLHAKERNFGSEKAFTDEELLDYLRQAAELIERTPTAAEINDSPFPSAQTYRNRFGSWGSAVKEAGLERLKKTPHQKQPKPKESHRVGYKDSSGGGYSGGGGNRATGGECPLCGEGYNHSLAKHLPCDATEEDE